jgi:hypothetical protein
MKHNQIFEVRIHYKNTTPTFVYTMNDTEMTWERAKGLMTRLSESKDKDNIENVHLICYDLIPNKVLEFKPDLSDSTVKYVRV